ncbi:MAG: DUF5989 family protein [archaeon]
MGNKALLLEFIDFLKHNRKWWLIPLLLILLLAGIIVLFSAPGPVPVFIYPML